MAAAFGFPPALFDQLPAPMRNQIYDLLLPHTPRTPAGLAHPNVGMTLEHIIEAAAMAGYASSTPTLRNEMFPFLELSMEHRPVPFTLLQRYLDLWVAANPNRDMQIDINVNRQFEHARVEVDMFPLLMRCRNNPGMRLRIRAQNTTYAGAKAAVAAHQAHGNTNNAMLSECHRVIKFKQFIKWCCHRPPRGCSYDRRRWYEFFGKAVDGLIVQFQVNNDGFVIHVKRKPTPDWMVSGIGSKDRGAPWMLRKCRDEWKTNVGLSNFPRASPPAPTRGETWPHMEVRGSGYNAAGTEQ